MAHIIFIDIPSVEDKFEESAKETVELRNKAQACLTILSQVPKPYQRKRRQFSRGILALSAFLKTNGGHKTTYCQFEELNDARFSEAVRQADYIGITASNTAYFNIVEEIAKYVKSIRTDIPVVVGGNHVSAMDEEVLLVCSEIDYVVRGEGERPLLGLANREKADNIRGLTYRVGTNIVRNQDQEALPEHSIPRPDYSLLPGDLNDYNFNIQTTRGCCYECYFCPNGFFWSKPRFAPVDDVVGELEFLNSRLKKGTMVHFSDNIFTLDKARTLELLASIRQRNIELQFSCDLKANHIDCELIEEMSKSNVVKVSIGFEDTNDGILRKANKGLRFEDNVRAAQMVKDCSDMFIEAYWIIGLPGSTRATILENLRDIRCLLEDGVVDVISPSTIFTPLPGTPMFDDCQRFGLKIVTKEWNRYLRSHFCPVYELDSLSKEELSECFVLYEETILDLYRKKLGVDDQGIRELHQTLISVPYGVFNSYCE